MQKTLKMTIPQSESEYEIYIDNSPVEALYKDLLARTQSRKRLIIFSEKVFKLYAKNLPFPKHEVFVLRDGEAQKNIKNYFKIVERLIQLKMTRKDVIISIGGGVVGDLAGYVAATYMRGIPFIQVPTTLLSMVDSSVGGKTAIDLMNAKNILGAFYQPECVYINLNFLNTLDARQYKSGLGEVLKYAFIEQNCIQGELLYLLEFMVANVNRIFERDFYYLEKMITSCLYLKMCVVNADEKEQGLRRVLNLGHTFGHALETLTKYKKYTHGEAVVYGLFVIFKWALKNCYIDTSYYNAAVELLKLYEFKPLEAKLDINKIVDLMKIDKKSESGQIRLVVPVSPRFVADKEVLNPQEFKAWLAEF